MSFSMNDGTRGSDDDTGGRDIADPVSCVDTRLDAERMPSVLSDIVAACDASEEARLVVTARYLRGKSQQDVASEIGLTRQRVRELEQQGLTALRQEMERRGLELSDFLS